MVSRCFEHSLCMWRKAEWCLNSRVLYFFVLDGVWREHKILIKNCCRDFARPVVWSTPRDKLNTPMAQGAETKFDRFSNTACGCTEDVVWCLFLFLSFLVSQFCILPSNTSNTHETASTSINQHQKYLNSYPNPDWSDCFQKFDEFCFSSGERFPYSHVGPGVRRLEKNLGPRCRAWSCSSTKRRCVKCRERHIIHFPARVAQGLSGG